MAGKLWPLLDVIKNCEKDNDEFINHLGQKLNEVTYFIKFNEWPNELLSNDKKVNIISYNFNDKTANKFSKLLLERWGSKFRDEIDLLLTKIQKNIVSAEFPIPEDEKELEKFVGIESYSEKEKKLRQELKTLLKEIVSLHLNMTFWPFFSINYNYTIVK